MKNRPYVQAKGMNKQGELTEELRRHLHLFTKYEGIAGIMLDGGISRGFADTLSEIDVVLFLHQQQFENYQNTLTPTAQGITKIDGYLYDIKLCCYEEELTNQYDQVALWDMSYAKIMYDPKGELQKLFQEKLRTEVAYESAGGYLFDAWWHYRLAGDIWIVREDTMQGHYILNQGIAPLLSVLYILNREFIPHEKWIIHMSHTLSWLPDQYEEKLAKITCIPDTSINCLQERQQAFDALWKELNARLCMLTNCPEGIDGTQEDSYHCLYEIYDKGEITLQEWEEKHSLADLNYDPLHKLVKYDGKKLIFQYELLKTLTENDMYSWFYEIVEAVRNNEKR